MRYVLVAAPAYLDRHGVPETPQALPGHCCSHLGCGPFGDAWTLRRGDVIAHVKVPGRLTINSSAAILAMVESGGGIGLVPDFTARAALAAGQVQQVLPEWEFCEPYTGSVHAVYMPGPHLALKVRAFIDYLAS